MRVLNKSLWPYTAVLLKSDDIAEVQPEEWCQKNIGTRFHDYYSYDIEGRRRKFAFRDEQALLVFKLTWGNYVKETSS